MWSKNWGLWLDYVDVFGIVNQFPVHNNSMPVILTQVGVELFYYIYPQQLAARGLFSPPVASYQGLIFTTDS